MKEREFDKNSATINTNGAFEAMALYYDRYIMRIQKSNRAEERDYLLDFCHFCREHIEPFLKTTRLNKVAADEKARVRFVAFQEEAIYLTVNND